MTNGLKIDTKRNPWNKGGKGNRTRQPNAFLTGRLREWTHREGEREWTVLQVLGSCSSPHLVNDEAFLTIRLFVKISDVSLQSLDPGELLFYAEVSNG